jgi:hypothetical protein
MRSVIVRIGLSAVLAAALMACGPQAPAGGKAEAPVVDADLKQLDVDTETRVKDLVAIHEALKAYHKANGKYPVTSPKADFIHQLSAPNGDWIPGLAPTYIPKLPSDPEQGSDTNGPMYQYASNGGSYKLIAHGLSDGCDEKVEVRGIRRDPGRTRADGTCWAFGFFSADMEKY